MKQFKIDAVAGEHFYNWINNNKKEGEKVWKEYLLNM